MTIQNRPMNHSVLVFHFDRMYRCTSLLTLIITAHDHLTKQHHCFFFASTYRFYIMRVTCVPCALCVCGTGTFWRAVAKPQKRFVIRMHRCSMRILNAISVFSFDLIASIHANRIWFKDIDSTNCTSHCIFIRKAASRLIQSKYYQFMFFASHVILFFARSFCSHSVHSLCCSLFAATFYIAWVSECCFVRTRSRQSGRIRKNSLRVIFNIMKIWLSKRCCCCYRYSCCCSLSFSLPLVGLKIKCVWVCTENTACTCINMPWILNGYIFVCCSRKHRWNSTLARTHTHSVRVTVVFIHFHRAYAQCFFILIFNG